MKDAIMKLIADYAEEHELAKSCGSEYITQNDSAQEDALKLVCDIFDLFADKTTLEQLLEELEDEDKTFYLYGESTGLMLTGKMEQLNAVLGDRLKNATVSCYIDSETGNYINIYLDEIF